jgi:hypothetical protein
MTESIKQTRQLLFFAEKLTRPWQRMGHTGEFTGPRNMPSLPSNYQQRGLFRLGERSYTDGAISERLLNMPCRAVAYANPNQFGRSAHIQTEFAKVPVFGNYNEVVFLGEFPNSKISQRFD